MWRINAGEEITINRIYVPARVISSLLMGRFRKPEPGEQVHNSSRDKI